VAFAFAPLAATVLLGVTLTVLEPSLLRMQEATAANDFSMTPIYGVVILVIVFAGVSVGALAAGGIIALGLRLPQARATPVSSEFNQVRESQSVVEAPTQSRAARVAVAAAALERRDAAALAYAAPGEDRRSSISVIDRNTSTERGFAGPASETRLTQGPRRANPRSRRAESRSGQ
jgi:hypothetical protein